MKASALFLAPLLGLALAAPAVPQDQCSLETSNIFQEVSQPDGSVLQVKGCDIAIPQDPLEANGLEKRDGMRRTLQVAWTITLGVSQDLIIRALINIVNDQVTLFTEQEGQGITVDNVVRQSGNLVSFDVNAKGKWGDAASSFLYDFAVGRVVGFIRRGVRAPNGRELLSLPGYCFSGPQ